MWLHPNPYQLGLATRKNHFQQNNLQKKDVDDLQRSRLASTCCETCTEADEYRLEKSDPYPYKNKIFRRIDRSRLREGFSYGKYLKERRGQLCAPKVFRRRSGGGGKDRGWYTARMRTLGFLTRVKEVKRV